MHQIWVNIHKTHQTSLLGGGLGELSAIWAPKSPPGPSSTRQQRHINQISRHAAAKHPPHTLSRTHAHHTPSRHKSHPTHPCPAPIPPFLQSPTLPHSTPHAHSQPGTPPPNPPSQHTPQAPPNRKPTIAHASHIPHTTHSTPAAASSEEVAAPPPAASPASAPVNTRGEGVRGG